MATPERLHGTALKRVAQKARRVAVRGAAGISALTLSLSVAAIARAQSENIYMQETGSRFKAAPKAPDANAEAADAAAQAPDMILGIEANTIFFIAAGVIAVFWFTLGGGRKPKVSRN